MIHQGLEFSSLRSTRQLTSLDDGMKVATLMQHEDEIKRVAKYQITDLSETVYMERAGTMNMWL